MNRYKLSKAGIHAKDGIQRFNGKKELYEKLLKEFPEDEHFKELEDAIARKDKTASFQAAHALKSLTGSLSFEKMYEDIVPLVEELRAGSLDHVDERMEILRNDYEMIVKAIREMG